MNSACWYAFKAVLTIYQISLFSFPMPITNVRWPPRRLATGRRRWCTRGKRPRQLPASLESLRHSSRKRCWEIPNNEKPQFDACFLGGQLWKPSVSQKVLKRKHNATQKMKYFLIGLSIQNSRGQISHFNLRHHYKGCGNYSMKLICLNEMIIRLGLP